MKEENEKTATPAKRPYPKVDFFGKGKDLFSKVFVLGLLCFVIMLPIILAAMLSKDISTAFLVVSVMLTLVLGFIIMIMLAVMSYLWKHYRKSGAPVSLFGLAAMGTGVVTLILLLIALFNIENDLGDTIFSYIPILIVIEFLISIPGLLFRFQRVREGDLFGIYPQVIASAERETNEYLDGYSARPVETVLPGVRRGEFQRFARFLMRNYLVFDYEKRGDELQLFFPMSMRVQATIIPKNDMLSWMKLKKGGRATVYITPEDYDFLGVPISYHLLCRKVAERVGDAYDIFVEGNEKGALEAFRLDRN